ncbi:MAG: FKBP-type peptidyl-prolyl cis-trans isomerase [Solirubrobacteraceae bacterium]
MRSRQALPALLAMLALALAAAGCGSSSPSRAAGIVTAPSDGPTADSVTAAPPSSSSSTTTSSSSTAGPPVKLPAALSTKPTVVPPKAPAPTKLVIKDLIKGTGPVVKPGATVTVQYVGVLYKNGKQFDASWNDGAGKPVTFPLSGVIAGWQQGIPGMRVGGRRELIIPPSLAYKSAPQPKIPPNSTLEFVIDLHSVS